jgi:hypothetical protein
MTATVVSETKASWILETGGTPVLLHSYGYSRVLMRVLPTRYYHHSSDHSKSEIRPQSKNHWEWFDKTSVPPYHPATSRLRKENQAMKKNIQAIKSGAAPILGKYVKLIKTGEIVEWKSFDPKKHLFEIKLPTGVVSIVHWREIERISPNDESEFLRSRKNSSK